MEKRDTAYIEGRMFIFYTVQKDSGILYKRWDAINLDMRMNTRGGKESKDREGGESGEKAGESGQMPLSRRETSLSGVNNLSVWERRSILKQVGSTWELWKF